MPEPIRQPAEPPRWEVASATCVRCEELTHQPVAVKDIERASAPAVTLYACPACAPGVVSPEWAWQLAIDHAWSCTACRSGSVLCPVGRTLDSVCRAARRRAQA